MSAIPPELTALFDAADTAEIKARAHARAGDALELAVGWAGRVEKIDRDRALPWSDRTVWNEHDLAGALFLRDFLQDALDDLPPPIRRKLTPFVEASDERFRGYTVDDPAGRMGTVAEVELGGRAWWWRRVPDSGPIVEDLARYS
ncbi:hypothetical protein BJ973_007753 [Actinoplanes tereljensis]|uniref:Uncharacterized protein n=1 Tax=Paractinoplanes tereljensis TaxID=571912 RepID=A0A919TV13_9ACTN|nr:hypothetical protein [Actinoplanes tereljensis]GIF24273.1 hypothetical protein Ate02nite_70030 [Actinoplanes tereljensis]